MSYIEILILAYALSVDAFIVSFSYGLAFDKDKETALKLSLFTGVFQGLMPVIGYYLTGFIKTYIQPYANVIIFLIFVFLGIKFILEAIRPHKTEKLCPDLFCLFLVGVATSVDAFSAGISLSLSGNYILKPACLIAIVTYINSNIGFYLGNKIQTLPEKYLNIIAGTLLIGLGILALF